MAKVNVVNKKVKFELNDIIKYQLLTHCYINHITLSELDYDCLINLSLNNECELNEFATEFAEKRLIQKLKTWVPAHAKEKPPEASVQTIRNTLCKLVKDNLIIKLGKNRKKISINPDLKLQNTGNILLSYSFIYVETKESE